MTRDTRKGDECITRSALHRAPWQSLVRLARFVGVAFAGFETPVGRWCLVEALYGITRCGKSDKRRAA